MEVVNGDKPLVEIVPNDVGIDIRDFVSQQMYKALIGPDIAQQVNTDALKITNTLFDSDLKIGIRLDKVARDYRSIYRYEVTDDQQVFIPGLIGLESLDYASPTVEDKSTLVRLYSGLMLAEELTKAKINNDNFFRLSFTKQFSLERLRAGGQFDELSEHGDPQVLEQHRRRTIARFASGIVMNKLFPQDDEAEEVHNVLKQQYEVALREDKLNYIMVSEVIPDKQIPTDSFPAEEQGYNLPFDFQTISTVLQGRIMRR